MAVLSIHRLVLSHFRNHLHTEIALDARPVALVGPNGAGKTNILEAISLLSPGRGLRRAAGDELARKPQSLGWKVTADVNGLKATHSVATWSEGIAGRLVRIDGKAATQTDLGRVLRVLWLVPSMDRLWTEAAEGRRRFLDRLTLSFLPDHAELSLTYEKAMRERNRLLKDGVSDRHWYTALEEQMGRTGAEIEANRQYALDKIAVAQTLAETAFPQATLSLEHAEGSADPSSLTAAWAAGRTRDLAAGRTLHGPHRTDLKAIYTAKGVRAEQCSTGEQKALLISLILANARALKADVASAPILLLDEVAAHLDEGRRAALYDEVTGLGAQALMTGTEATLFDSLGKRAQVLSVHDIDGASSVTP